MVDLYTARFLFENNFSHNLVSNAKIVKQKILEHNTLHQKQIEMMLQILFFLP